MLQGMGFNGVPERLDKLTQVLVAMDEIHSRIHRGGFFSAGISDPALADSGVLELLLQTPTTGGIHARFAGSLGGDARAQLFEGTTFTAAGAAVAAINRNRFSQNTTGLTITSGATLTLDGTPLFDGFIPGGTGQPMSPGGTARTFQEFILAQDTVYLVRLTNVSGAVQVATQVVDFYDTNLF